MGIVHADLTVMSSDRRVRETLRLIVDTGSIFTWVPRPILHRLGIIPVRTQRFRTIDGWTAPKETGEAPIELEGLVGTIPVVFGEEGDVPVLGVTALEILGLHVDPRTGRLEQEDVTLALAAV